MCISSLIVDALIILTDIMAILVTHDLAVGFKQGSKSIALLDGLNLTLEEGTMVALLGRNGAGKSTLLKALTCDTLPVSGTIEINRRLSTEISKR